MKNKKGFTLIELLAVIVILAVIMVIAVPKILDIIESSKKSAAESSIKLVKDAIKTQVATSGMSGVTFEKGEDGCYTFDFDDENDVNVQKLSLKNKNKMGGNISYCETKFPEEKNNLTFEGTSPVTENGGNNNVPIEIVPKYFAYGTPTTSSTTDYTTLGKKVFTTLYSDGITVGVCINEGGLFCIKINDYENSLISLKSHFGERYCTAGTSNGKPNYVCDSGDFSCGANSYGVVDCGVDSTGGFCRVYETGTFSCD